MPTVLVGTVKVLAVSPEIAVPPVLLLVVFLYHCTERLPSPECAMVRVREAPLQSLLKAAGCVVIAGKDCTITSATLLTAGVQPVSLDTTA